MRSEGARWVVASVAFFSMLGIALGLGFAMCEAGHCAVPALDRASAVLADRWRHPGLDVAMQVVTAFGSIAVLLPASVAVGAWMRWHGAPVLTSCFVPLAVLGAWTVSWLAKLLVARPRPDAFEPLIAMPVDLSYPSAHAMQFAAFAAACALRPGGAPTWRVLGLAAALAALVGGTRIYLQVHYLTDVLAGLAAAALWVVALRSLPIWRGRLA